jgi:ATP-dependent helicase Lhr and Lhr-like helicase
VQQANGEVQWWTFAGGLANSIVADHLDGASKAKTDNLCLRFSSALKLADVKSLIASKMQEQLAPEPSEEAIANLKFGECLPAAIAREVFSARFDDPDAIMNIRAELMRVVNSNEYHD